MIKEGGGVGPGPLGKVAPLFQIKT